jgi:hypothetical protein
MSATLWQLEGHTGHISESGWAAAIDVCRPFEGMSLGIGLQDARPETSLPWRLLGVLLGDGSPVDASRIDAYVRGTDLVATYAEAPPRQVRAQIYWRRLSAAEFSPPHAAQIVAAFDLIVSVNTPLLDCDPEAAVQSILPASDLLNLRIQKDGGCRAAPLDEPQLESASEATGCFIARPSGSQFSYVEIVHPVDYTDIDITHGDSAPPRVRIVHQFFRERLEKGVILRARMRAGIVARTADETTAADAYSRFAAMEPPLTV